MIFRRQRRSETRLPAYSPQPPELPPQRLDFAYLCEQYDPQYDPIGAPPVAFRETGETK